MSKDHRTSGGLNKDELPEILKTSSDLLEHIWMSGSKHRAKHLTIIYFVLLAYGIYTLYVREYSLAAATIIPSFSLPYTWGAVDGPNAIKNSILRYLLPSYGHKHEHKQWMPKRHMWIDGPVTDVFIDPFYMIPLYLAQWYSIVGAFWVLEDIPYARPFFLLVPMLLVSRIEYWLRYDYYLAWKEKMLFTQTLGWQFVVAGLGLALYTFTPDFSAIILMWNVLPWILINAWNQGKGMWPSAQFTMGGPHWKLGTSQAEVGLWEQLEKESEYARLRKQKIPGNWDLPTPLVRDPQMMSKIPFSTPLERGYFATSLDRKHQSSFPTALYRGDSDGDDEITVEQREIDRARHLLKVMFARNPTLEDELIQSKLVDLHKDVVAKRRTELEDELINKTRARIANQRYHKPRRARDSIAQTVPYDSFGDTPAQTPYVSIVEDPAAYDPNVSASSGDDNGNVTDVFKLDPNYPFLSFPHRLWPESLVAVYGTPKSLSSRGMSVLKSVAISILQFSLFCLAVRVTLITTGIAPLEEHYRARYGGAVTSLALLMSTVGMAWRWLAQGMLVVADKVEFWVAAATILVEIVVNDGVVAVALVLAIAIGWIFWVKWTKWARLDFVEDGDAK